MRWKRIYHLSHPRSSSVNFVIFLDNRALEYTGIDDAISILAALGKSTTMIKRNLLDAFWYVPVPSIN